MIKQILLIIASFFMAAAMQLVFHELGHVVMVLLTGNIFVSVSLPHPAIIYRLTNHLEYSAGLIAYGGFLLPFILGAWSAVILPLLKEGFFKKILAFFQGMNFLALISGIIPYLIVLAGKGDLLTWDGIEDDLFVTVRELGNYASYFLLLLAFMGIVCGLSAIKEIKQYII